MPVISPPVCFIVGLRLAHGEWLSWLKANAGVLGFETPRTAQMLLKVAGANTKPASRLEPVEALAISRQTWGHADTIATKHTGDPGSYTPGIYIEAVRIASLEHGQRPDRQICPSTTVADAAEKGANLHSSAVAPEP